MNIVLLSGGSGKRLWPLSNDVRSKQFIKIFRTADGGHESMVQRVYRQIKAVDPDATVTIATSKTQVSAIHNQLGEAVGISVEPCRRDTFPAIVLATAYLVDVQGVDPEQPVVVCPVDPYVQDDYFAALKALGEQAALGQANLVLMGIEPTYPSEKYGYIIPKSDAPVSEVETFKEKPDDAETAKGYIARGALWNGGVFAYKLGYVLDRARELLDYTSYQDLFDRYDTLPKISFDYAVVEKEPKIQVMRFAGQWKDLGTWNTLTEAMGRAGGGGGHPQRHLQERPYRQRAECAGAGHGPAGRGDFRQPGGHPGVGQGAVQLYQALCGQDRPADHVCRKVLGQLPGAGCGKGKPDHQGHAEPGPQHELSQPPAPRRGVGGDFRHRPHGGG